MFKNAKDILVIAVAALSLAACQKPAEPAAAPADAAATPAAAPAAPVTPAATAAGEVCGGIAGVQCKNDGEFCKNAIGQCQVADVQGVCTKKPEICTEQYLPVCGCDGKTYGNACKADQAGVSVAAAGECAKKG